MRKQLKCTLRNNNLQSFLICISIRVFGIFFTNTILSSIRFFFFCMMGETSFSTSERTNDRYHGRGCNMRTRVYMSNLFMTSVVHADFGANIRGAKRGDIGTPDERGIEKEWKRVTRPKHVRSTRIHTK